MDFDLFDNPWSPGGQMHSQAPYVHQWQEYGWGHGNEFFTPKTKKQIRNEGLLQLAILAAVVAAPAVIGAIGATGGGGAAAAGGSAAASGGAAAAGGSGAAAAGGASAQAAGAAVGQGAVAAGAGAAAAGGGVSAGTVASAALAAQAALQPFLQQGAEQAVRQAAQQGADALNDHFHQQTQERPSFVFEPGGQQVEFDPSDLDDFDPPQARPRKRHRGMGILKRLVQEIENSRPLERLLEASRSKGSGFLSQQAVSHLANIIQDELSQVENPWETGEYTNALEERPERDDDDDDRKGPRSYVIFRDSYASDLVENSVYYDAKRQKGWKILVVKNVADLAKKLKGKEVDNLFFVSHGNVTQSLFYIGSDLIAAATSSLARLNPLRGIHAHNVVLFSCMAGRRPPIGSQTIPFGADAVLSAVASTFNANAYGHQGWSFASQSNYRGLKDLSLFNTPGNIKFVISGLHPTDSPTVNDPANNPFETAYWQGAGRWTMSDPNGNISEIDRALYITNDGQFSFTGYSWRNHDYIKPYIDYFFERIADPGMTHQQKGYGAIEGAPDFGP